MAWAAHGDEAARGPPRTLAEDVAAPHGGEERRRGGGVTGAEENTLPFPVAFIMCFLLLFLFYFVIMMA